MYTRVLNTTSATKIYNGCGVWLQYGHQYWSPENTQYGCPYCIHSTGTHTWYLVANQYGQHCADTVLIKKIHRWRENSTYIRKHRK